MNELSDLINESQENLVDEKRNYIGASLIGSPCWRQIWYEYKGYKGEKPTAKTRRTWEIGKWLEQAVFEWLAGANILVLRNYPELCDSTLPFFRGNVDGIWVYGGGEIKKAIIEVKTAKDASFKQFIKSGLKIWNPRYYSQVQSYMGMSSILNTYIIVLNKDNSDLSDEVITFDSKHYQELKIKASIIEQAKEPPPRVNSSPLWYQCKTCKFNRICHS